MTRRIKGLERLFHAADIEVDAAGLAAFRVFFGLLTLVLTLRFMGEGWIERCFLQPSFFFSFWGFEWVQVLPPWAIYSVFGIMALASLCVLLGLFYRLAMVTFFLCFTYVELIDVTNYLNHYYLVSLLAFLLSWMPLGYAYGLDGLRRPTKRRTTLPNWMTWIIRFQIGVVYAYASVAKTGPDWLLHGQPLEIWLAARTDTPVLGAFFGQAWTPLAMSWGGFLFDALVIPSMLWTRTRPFAYMVAVCFHCTVGMLFNIGMFPWIMLMSLTIFFSPSWPRRCMKAFGSAPTPWAPRVTPPTWTRRIAMSAMGVFLVFQTFWPARAFLYEGNTLWHEQGMRFSWKVMVREKNGSITYKVRTNRWQRQRHVFPSQYLTAHQEREMSAQPDQILQLAHHIANDLAQDGHRDIEVRVDALASINGRTMQHLIDPAVDLCKINDGFAPATWVTEAPSGPPLKLRPVRGIAMVSRRN